MKTLINIITYCIIPIAIVYSVLTFVGINVKINGNSMNDTYKNGDLVFCEKISYRIKEPKRYDVIVFKQDDKIREHNNFYIIKRIYGLPGETVQISNSVIYINGEPIEDTYKKDDFFNSGLAEEKITLGKDEYFVLGDNRNASDDSRSETVGIVKKKQILGRVMFMYPRLNSIESEDK